MLAFALPIERFDAPRVFHAAATPLQVHVEQCGEAFLDELERAMFPELRPQQAAAGNASDHADTKQRAAARRKLVHDNHYHNLGLDEFGPEATEVQIRTAYRKALLKYHPDKNSTMKDFSTDPMFLAVQEAYEVLSDPEKRRRYDSQFQFDDSIPSETDVGDFFELFRPVFRRNARFSTRKPVPDLGEPDTPPEQVRAFYKFWARFQSWRDFTDLTEYNPEEATSREEKRWMQRQVDAQSRKLKKKEARRIQSLLELAERRDPRLQAMRERARLEQERVKREKADRKERERLQREKQEEARRRAQEEAEQARRRAEQAEREERERKKQELRKERAAFRSAMVALREAGVPGVPSHERVDEMKKLLFLPQLQELNPLLSAGVEHKGARAAEAVRKVQEVVSAAQRAAESGERERLQQLEATRRSLEAMTVAAKAARDVPWSEDELAALQKAMSKFKPGTRQRWQMVAKTVNMLQLGHERTPQECVAKGNSLLEDMRKSNSEKAFEKFKSQRDVLKHISSEPTQRLDPIAAVAAAVNSGQLSTEPARPAAAAAAASAEADAAAPDWTAEQQRALETALRTFPASMDKNERWVKIAEAVPGRTKKECVERFKWIRQQLLAKKQASGAR